jgi:iron uptake system component EfeO
MRLPYLSALAAVTGLAALNLAGCANSDATKGAAIAVNATDSTCEVARRELTAGTITFDITNKGTQVTEVYVYAPGDRIVTERENITPGSKTSLVVELKAGKYQIACKPGMKGNGIRQDITVSGTAAQKHDPRLDKALADYRAYVTEQVDDSLAKTREFVAAVKAGDVDKAKDLYAPSRVGWERVEPVAESFGDIDPKIDAREADLEAGQKWTGWHRLEKALWKTESVEGEEDYGNQLVKDLEDLKTKIATVEITPTSMANGAKELLDEVATGKVTGEEEAFSHTDLWDFKANVDGAKKVFDKVEELLAGYEEGDGYVSYDTVEEPERKKLSEAVNTLGEPLSHLAGAVVE